MKRSQSMLAACVGLLIAAGAAFGGPPNPPHFDVYVAPGAGQLITGMILEDGSNPTLGERVFGAELGEIAPNFSEDPGFLAPEGTFPAGFAIGFNILDHLRIWDGADFDGHSPSTMNLSFGPSGGGLMRDTTLPPASPFVAGFDLPIDAAGGYHHHLDYLLSAPADPGVYLLTLEFTTTVPGLADSEPFYIVFNNGQSEADHDAAMAFVRENIVPAPAALCALLPLALGAMARHRDARRSIGPLPVV